MLFPLAALGIVAFVVAAGCLAADLLPLRPANAATSGLALVDAVLLVVAGQASRPLAVVAAAALVAQALRLGSSTPAHDRARRAGGDELLAGADDRDPHRRSRGRHRGRRRPRVQRRVDADAEELEPAAHALAHVRRIARRSRR